MTYIKHDFHALRGCESPAEFRLIDAFRKTSAEDLCFVLSVGEEWIKNPHKGAHTYIGSWIDPSAGWSAGTIALYSQAEHFSGGPRPYRSDLMLVGNSQALIIEVDGKHHDLQRSYDDRRDRVLTREARVLRVPADHILHGDVDALARELLDIAVVINPRGAPPVAAIALRDPDWDWEPYPAPVRVKKRTG